MYIKIKVFPNSKKEELFKENETNFKVFVKQKAERNMANERVREVMALHFKIPVSRVRIISGHRSHGKILDIDL